MEHSPGDAAARPSPLLTEPPAARRPWWQALRGYPRLRPLSEGGLLIAPLMAAGVAAARYAPLAAPLAFAAAGAIAFAFRDPHREVRATPGLALAPADGQVIHVTTVWDEFWEEEMVEIATFLAIWDVHVQRSPLAGAIVEQLRRPGGYLPAMTQAATHGNNQVTTYLDTAHGPCTVTQISGLVARRIVTWQRPGERLDQGERLGMIKFGSQVTLRLPRDAEPLVAPGDAVRAGVTPMARFARPPATDLPAEAARQTENGRGRAMPPASS